MRKFVVEIGGIPTGLECRTFAHPHMNIDRTVDRAGSSKSASAQTRDQVILPKVPLDFTDNQT